MNTDYDYGYEIDEHKVDEIDVEYAWAFGLIAAILLIAVVLSFLVG